MYKSLLLVFSFYILHFTFYIPSQAFFVSNHACPGSTQQRQCTCEKLASDDFCDLSDSRTICGECSDPTSLPVLPPTSSDLPVTSGNTPPATSPSTSLNPNPQTLPSNSNLPTKEEAAIYRVVQGTIPDEAVKPEPEQNIIQKLLSSIPLISALFAQPLNPNSLPKFNAQADTLSQSSVPTGVRPKEDADFLSKFKGWLGGDSGVYGKTLPPIEGVKDDIVSYEQLYQQGNFPEGIYPIVDPTPTPTPRATAI